MLFAIVGHKMMFGLDDPGRKKITRARAGDDQYQNQKAGEEFHYRQYKEI
jgi:hypothetical protein